MIRKSLILFLLLHLSAGWAEILKTESDVQKIHSEFEAFAREVFLKDYYLPVDINLKFEKAWSYSMNGSAGFRDENGLTVGRPIAKRVQITLRFAPNQFWRNFYREGFVWIACHELGHIVGGEPVNELLKGFPGQEGLTIEGQADYFASKKCMDAWLRWVDTNHLPDPEFAPNDEESSVIENLCLKRFEDSNSSRKCQIQLLAAREGFRLIDYDLKYLQVDKSRSDYMYTAHPKLNCRGATALNAVMGFERPICWFYPDTLKKLDLKSVLDRDLVVKNEKYTFCGNYKIDLEIIDKTFKKSPWEYKSTIKRLDKMAKKYQPAVTSMLQICQEDWADDTEVSKQYAKMVSELKKKIQFLEKF